MPESKNENTSRKKSGDLEPMTMTFEFAMQLLYKMYGFESFEILGTLNLLGPFESLSLFPSGDSSK